MGGGMEANKNGFIEDWSTARENLEHNFRWTRRNLALVGFVGIAFPSSSTRASSKNLYFLNFSLIFYSYFIG
ncbi:hypothetical protein SLE2022_273200 [Rubroshorea leprosula]